MKTNKPTLVSFDLCPFVQRTVIVLIEKNFEFEKKLIDLANKLDWFYIPFFMRIAKLEEMCSLHILDAYPKL